MKIKNQKSKKRILTFLALSLVVLIGIGAGFSFLSDFDEATNKFTLGKTDIELEEPNWKNPTKTVTEINGIASPTLNRSGEKVLKGDVLTYCVTATNADTVAHDIVITDVIENGLTVDVDSISHAGKYDSATRTITWTIKNVAKLSEMSVYFKATVNENAVTEVTNQALAKVGTSDAKLTNKVENPLTQEPQNPTKKVAPESDAGVSGSPVTVGDIITYSMTIYNNADTAGTVTVKDTLDSQVSFVSASDGGVYDAGVVTWEFSNMPAHSSKTISLKVKVENVILNGKLDPITNKALVTDPTNSYTTNTVTIPVVNPDQPKVPTKAVDPSSSAGTNGAKVSVGDKITYKIGYYNHESNAVNVTIKDIISVGLAVDTASISNGGTYNSTTRTITWNIANAPATSNGFVTFTATVTEDAVVKVANEAFVKIGDNNEVKTNKVTNPVEDVNRPGDTEIKDPTVTSISGDSYLRFKVEFMDSTGKRLTDVNRINKILDTLYYDTSYIYQGTVPDTSILTSNIVKGQSYTSAQLANMVVAGSVFKEYNTNLFTFDTSRASSAAVRYYNYTANGGVFTEGSIATLFTNSVMPSDWNNSDIEILGEGYMIKVTAQVCQIEGLTQDAAYNELDKQAPNP